MKKTTLAILSLCAMMLIGLCMLLTPLSAKADSNGAFVMSDGQKEQGENLKQIVNWGSMSELLVWIGVMQCSEKGLIDLHAPVAGYLPEDFVSNAGIPSDITMLDLMNQTSGFQECRTGHFLMQDEMLSSLEDHLIRNKTPQITKAGEYMAYSEFNSTLAAYVLECVTGQAYYDLVKNEIFVPLNMTNTSVYYDYSDCEAVKQMTDASVPLYGFYPANSARGTTEEIGILLADLVSGNSVLLSDNSLKEMFTPSLNYRLSSGGRIAHGLVCYNYFDKPVMGIKYTQSTGQGCLFIRPEEKKYFFAFSTSGNPRTIHEDELKTLFGEKSGESGKFTKKLSDMQGTYVKANHIQKGMGKIVSLFGVYKLFALGENSLALSPGSSTPYLTQISNSGFCTTDGEEGHFYLTGGGERIIEFPSYDMIPYPSWIQPVEFALLILYEIGVTYSFFVLAVAVIGLISRLVSKKEGDGLRFKKYHYIQCGSMLFHGIIFHMMTMYYLAGYNPYITKPASLMYYFGMVLSVVYWLFFISSGRKEECPKFTKICYFVTGGFAVLQVVFSLAFSLVLNR